MRFRCRFASTLEVALAAVLLAAPAIADGGAQAPAWPNLLSEAGRRAAMALPKSSPYHLEPTLQDLEDARPDVAPSRTAKQRWERARIAAGAPPNARANNPTGDVTGETQSETAIAAFGDHIVVAWNDSHGFTAGNTVSSFAYSTDGGATFTDGGNVPLASVGDQAFGDCTLDVDADGNFYLCQIYVSGGLQSTGVHRGVFNGASFAWGSPVIAASGATGAIDKCYLCVDRGRGDVYVSYTRFGTPVTIEVVRGTALGTAWSAPAVLDSGTSGIQGSRPVVGPEGNLYVCWQSGWGFINCDLTNAAGQISFRRSLSGTFPAFQPVLTAGSVTMNWLSYWGGNLRGNALFFPDMAVDRSGGPNHGNIYVVWNEAAPWTANNASGITTAETEPNNTPSDASVATITPGDDATGAILATNDFDYWRVAVTAGQHVLLRLEPQGFTCGVSTPPRNFQLRLFKGVAGAAGDTILANSNLSGFISEIVFDANETATYLLRVRNVNNTGTQTGTYLLKSRTLAYGTPNPARDMRDICVSHSTNHGVSFVREVLANTDAAGEDNSIPAIAVDGRGCVHAFFYDSRDARGAKALRRYYDGVSSDGGASYAVNNPVSDQLLYYNLNTVAVPNYGEYNQACTNVVDSTRVHVAWSDERLTNAAGSGVDAYTAVVQSCVGLSCPPDSAIAAAASVTRHFCVSNCGTFATSFDLTVSDTQGWCSSAPAQLDVAAGTDSCFDVICTVPAGTPLGVASTLSVTATSSACRACAAACSTHVVSRGMVPVAVEALEANAGAGGVLLQWRLSAAALSAIRDVRVERADAAAGPYRAVGPPRAPEREMSWQDASAEPGRTYWYRLVLAPARGAEFIAGPLLVSTGAGTLHTRLDAAAENADGAVQFRYRIGTAGAVRLELFDVLGRRLRIVDAGIRSTGSHLAGWDRTDEAGARVARGVYLVELQAPGTTITTKLVLTHD